MSIKKSLKIVTVNPTLDTSAYANLDTVGTVQTLADALAYSGAMGKVVSVAIVDKDKQAAALDVLFFSASPTVASADNAALDISDSEMGTKYLGRAAVAAASYTTTASNSDVCVTGLAIPVTSTNATANIYMQIQSKGSPTYTAAGLTIKVGIEQD